MEYLTKTTRRLVALYSVVMFLVHLSLVGGELHIKQIAQYDNGNPTVTQDVEGIASFTVNPVDVLYQFLCIRGYANATLTWNGPGVQSLVITSEGLRFSLLSPTDNYIGTYTCRDTFNNEEVTIYLTTENPAVRRINETITVKQGQSTTIKFYGSGIPLPYPGPDDISWQLNDVLLQSDTFSSNKKSLTIHNVQPSDHGVYRFTLTKGSNEFTQTASDTTMLVVLAVPSVISDPVNVTGVKEWNSFQLSCVVNGTLPFTVSWAKVDSSLPAGRHSITNDIFNSTILSTLTISDSRVSDSGLYKCMASFSDRTNETESESAHVTIQGGISFEHVSSDGNAVRHNSSLLFIPTGTNFSVVCQGSGDYLTWHGPGNMNVSTISSDVPWQETNSDSFQSLIFRNFDSSVSGIYGCTSSLGASDRIFISNNNPIIYTQDETVRVGITTNSTITVYAGGNPVPTFNDVSWYFNGALIDPVTNPHYDIMSSDSVYVLSIIAPSSQVTGTYTVIVSTSQGNDSVSVNVTYFDPPAITVTPDVQMLEPMTGANVTINCNATGELPVTYSWEYNGSPSLPDGVMISNEGHTLTINSAMAIHHTGRYTCLAYDGITTSTKGIDIFVKFAPTASVGDSLSIKEPFLNQMIRSDHSTVLIYYCSGAGYPNPSLAWKFNGNTELPSGVTQVMSGEILHLIINPPIMLGYEGTYQCVANNSINTSIASLNITVLFTPVISSIFSTNPIYIDTSLASSSPYTFNCPSSACVMNCVAWGRPLPSLMWVDDNNQVLSTNYIVMHDSVVIASFEWEEGNRSTSTYHCQADNNYISRQTVRVVTTAMTPPTINTSLIEDANVIIMRLRLSHTNCSESNSRSSQLQQSLVQVVLSLCQSCQNPTEIISVTGKCQSDSTIFKVNVSSPNPAMNGLVSRAIADWWANGPLVSLGDMLYPIDRSCDFIVDPSTADPYQCEVIPFTSSSPSVTMSPTPSITTASPFVQIFWAVLVALISALLLVVIVVLITFLCLCLRTYNRRNKMRPEVAGAWSNSTTTLKTYRSANSQQELINETSFNGRRSQELSGSSNEMFDNPEYLQTNLVRQVQRVSANFEFSSPLSGSWRQIQTTPTNSPPLSQEEIRANNIGSDQSLRNTPVQEMLYQPALGASNHNDDVDGHYAQIRISAVRQPQRVAGYISRSNERIPHHYNHSSLPRQPPMSHNYAQPDNNRRYATRAGYRMRGMSTPALADPIPYSIPVASHTNIHRSARSRSGSHNSLPFVTSNSQQQGAPHHGPDKVLPPVNESYFSESRPQPWFNDETDIVTPSSVPDYEMQHPYGFSPTSQIMPGQESQNVSSASINKPSFTTYIEV